jgi:hypothetical protein
MYSSQNRRKSVIHNFFLHSVPRGASWTSLHIDFSFRKLTYINILSTGSETAVQF